MKFKNGQKVLIKFKKHTQRDGKVVVELETIVRTFLELSSWGVFFQTQSSTTAFLPMWCVVNIAEATETDS